MENWHIIALASIFTIAFLALLIQVSLLRRDVGEVSGRIETRSTGRHRLGRMADDYGNSQTLGRQQRRRQEMAAETWIPAWPPTAGRRPGYQGVSGASRSRMA